VFIKEKLNKLKELRINSNTHENEEFFDVQTEFSDNHYKEYLFKNTKKIRRSEIPPKPSESSLKVLLKYLSKSIGKDLTKIPLPATLFSEPLSFLQRLSEHGEYYYLLDKAAKCNDSLEQMTYVTAFSISIYNLLADRIAKPFNPLLNETFEFDRLDDLGWRTLTEQVGHQPPKLAHVVIF
jgi:hypothetical protein